MTQVRLPIKFVIKQQDIQEDAKKYFEQHKRLHPVRFGFSVAYAESLEYGSGPLRDFQPTVDGGNYTYESVWNGLNEWARKKLKMNDKEHRENFVTGVANRMWDVGLNPHPYWRPAMLWLESNMQRLFDEGHSLFEIADMAMNIADKCIMDQNLPYEGGLQLSAKVEEIDPREIKDLRDYNDDERNFLFESSRWGGKK